MNIIHWYWEFLPTFTFAWLWHSLQTLTNHMTSFPGHIKEGLGMRLRFLCVCVCVHAPSCRHTSQHLRHVFERVLWQVSCAATTRSMACQAVPMISSRTKLSETSGGSQGSLWVYRKEDWYILHAHNKSNTAIYTMWVRQLLVLFTITR